MRYFLSMILFIIIMAITVCDKDPTKPSRGTGKLKIGLTDAPAKFDSVNITFSEISAHIDDEWITVRGVDTTVNLLDLSNGRSIIIGSADVPAGHYSQIRIIIDTAWVVVDGINHPLTVPSGVQTGLKLGPQFTINEGSTVELMVDFDTNRSIVTTGPPNNPKDYKLKPRLRLILMPITGSISGKVKNSKHLPIAYAIVEDDTLTSSNVDKNSGKFMLAFLPEGFYTVAIKDTLNQLFEKNDIKVVAGSDNNLGLISLQ